VASASVPDFDRRLLGAYTAISEAEARTLLRPEVYAAIDWTLPLAHVDEWLGRAPRGTALERMLWIDARTVLPDNLLLAEDKMGMAAGVEARVPLLDLEFARLAEAVPGTMKLRPGRRKAIYRRACARWVGTATSRRRQIGFTNPMAQWLRGPYQRALFPSGGHGSFVANYGRPERLEEMLREHRDGRHDHTRKLFLLASLDAWHLTFCGR
jgi:asparagine synthase (glutamine-hydrolysing)